MPEQEIPSETLDQQIPASTVSESAPTPSEPPTTSEPARIARSAPDRRRVLCVARDLLAGTPGHADTVAALEAIADHADQLEAAVWVPSEEREAPRVARFPGDFDCCRSAAEAVGEFLSARKKFAPFNTAHEGYAVLLEEVEELWEAVRGHRCPENLARMRAEAIQVAAMALAFVEECTPQIGGAA